MKSIHKGLKPYDCSICHSKFSYLRNLRYHEKTAHEKEKSSFTGESNDFQCPKCSDCFLHKSRLTQHINEFHSNSYFIDKKKLRCEMCGISVTDKGKLKMHMRAKHLKEKTVYIKEENDEKTSYVKEETSLSESNEKEKSLGQKIVKIMYPRSGVYDFQCPQCSDCFFQKSRLIQHMNEFHSEGVEKKLRCVSCDVGFSNDSELKEHMRTKHLEIAKQKYARD